VRVQIPPSAQESEKWKHLLGGKGDRSRKPEGDDTSWFDSTCFRMEQTWMLVFHSRLLNGRAVIGA
jgi:hypothetical protein